MATRLTPLPGDDPARADTSCLPNPPGLTRRRLLAAAVGCIGSTAFATVGPAQGQAPAGGFPNRPITLLVPWPAGGATDLTMRLLAQAASRELGQNVVVENRAGAGGTMAMPVLQQAAPDGYTIAQIPQPVFRAPWTHKVLWDPVRDVTPILQLSGVTFGVVVPAASPFRHFDELFEWARRHPGQLMVGTNGIGTTPHVVMDELMRRRGLDWVHVPYKGTAEQMVAVASGQLMVGINSNGFAPFVDSGQLRLLVTFGEQRARRWPEVPTLRELGHGIVAMSPYGLGGPRGMSPAVVERLHQAFKAAMHDPVHLAELRKYDQELAYLGPEEYGRAMREAYRQERLAVERMGLARTGG
ncbi:tripartite tricarboxylate transporter substrate binding protein [Caldimonas tepidiphila]|uniref:tripartite tricarboxylate transporter substrate binding protein n=1 Tax=Caldimonas tepidiphila TaxID=2315841 RepID=UPI000E5B9F4E|nr:tripartite tricarboxylate transporter substrate binding protein [Caldimonas tepidiphila]